MSTGRGFRVNMVEAFGLDPSCSQLGHVLFSQKKKKIIAGFSIAPFSTSFTFFFQFKNIQTPK